ncbi:putative leucine-rich repeat receptor-like serine/threonine-protein kinase At2g19230 [Phragmites australis]|uniref:putative leucine-rich repeat receptor-like serine/threonine-protein kinase At2g19230 n=1 Tax=Phragmites australis TaxID=29695 RepID=UPI002D79128F|nr:putative leucine-rich repeat receptor-like serine/threonine-protein kinase At2g19230 [Phragmites australis]
MARSTPRTMAARSWLLQLVLAAAAGGVLRVRGQGLPDSTGFVSIDCGIPEKSSYVDGVTKLPYVSDAGFTDAGSNHNVSAEYINPSCSKRYLNLRSFPDAARSCYTLGSLAPGSKYLLRATFMYGNYDGLSRPPVFDLHLGVNFWTTVNITAADLAVLAEVIAIVRDDVVLVCLVNTGSGTPFISGLDLRPLTSTLYPQVNATQGLVLLARRNFGPSDSTVVVRYPDDPYDRAWTPWSNPAEWSEISTTEKVGGTAMAAPSAVMQTAITPLNASKNIDFSWDAVPNQVYPAPGYISNVHVAELRSLAGNATRQFYLTINGKLWYGLPETPHYLFTDVIYDREPHQGFNQYNVSLNATANSTLPPIINAVEVFSVISTANIGTEAQDVSAITGIKAKYQVKKNWMGDPCAPKALAWDGLSCSYDISGPPRITTVNLSSSGLSGDISFYFAKLKATQYLNLSHNKLTGSIPDVLSQLPSLNVIDLTGNQLNGSIPSGILKRIQDGSLKLRYGDNPNLCNDGSCKSTKKMSSSMLAVYIAVPVVAFVVVGTLVLLLFLMRKKKAKSCVKPLNGVRDVQPRSQNGNGHGLPQLENRRFTYRELEAITNNFQRVLGRGGFGSVYDGFLKDGTQVAVKLRSQSSNQSVREFLTEVQTLTKIHHKNIVSLIGYCKDGEFLALVYEHMSEGTLEDKLRGRDRNAGSLTWRQRLRIALESAQGLEYLHKACRPACVHRDVKTSNILLNADLEAKIADFGLLKAFQRDDDTHVSTDRVVGTHGYLAPEYAAALQLTEKSDVYSFGIVLLEVITGQPPILRCPEPTSIVQWVRQRLARGDIDDAVDARMRGGYDVNAVWKAADVALKCTAQAPAQRPTMTDVVAQLQECLGLEEGR